MTLLDGKAHSVDSSDAAFQTAGALALREAASDATIHLLEPVAEVSVLVGDDYVGPVMSDLSSRRGRVLGTEQSPGGRTLIKAEVPEIEIGRYAIDLRSSLTAPPASAATTHGTNPCRRKWRTGSGKRRAPPRDRRRQARCAPAHAPSPGRLRNASLRSDGRLRQSAHSGQLRRIR
ncbi:hypothetical protein SHKM778_63160 [Streptomyces sp. KM77-8]|uniref:Elongation factor EFG domain-containing protein n=1 Tax=Streptomyces haneummycinicus TaxID=3074435 RepID=A0AAT9HRG9_9ACTN